MTSLARRNNRKRYHGEKFKDEGTSRLALLQASFPDATRSDCHRFLFAFSTVAEAGKHLHAYLEWKSVHGLNDSQKRHNQSDSIDWDLAIRAAHHYHCASAERRSSSGSNMPPLEANEVQQISVAPPPIDSQEKKDFSIPIMQDADGNFIICVVPARLNIHQISKEVYTTAFALYLYTKWQLIEDNNDPQTHSSKKMTLLIDTRPAPGWPNTPVTQLLGWMGHTITALHRLFPHCLARCLVFPVPTFAVTLYNCIIRPVLPADVRHCIVLFAGEAQAQSPFPLLEPHVTAQQCQIMEQWRRHAFGK